MKFDRKHFDDFLKIKGERNILRRPVKLGEEEEKRGKREEVEAEK